MFSRYNNLANINGFPGKVVKRTHVMCTYPAPAAATATRGPFMRLLIRLWLEPRPAT